MINLFWICIYIAAIRYIIREIRSAMEAETLPREQKLRLAAEIALFLAVVSAYCFTK